MKDLLILIISFLVLFLALTIIISKIRKRKLFKAQIDSKHYSDTIDDDETYVGRAYDRLYNNDIQGAIDNLNSAIKIKPENEARYLMRGKLKLKAKDYKDAISDFSKAITLSPDHGEAFYYRGQAKSNLGDSHSAEFDFLEAEKLGYRNNLKDA